MKSGMVAALAGTVLACGVAGCTKTAEKAGSAAWAVVRPIGLVLDPPSRLMAGTPVENADELEYEKAYIAKTRPGVGGTQIPPELSEPGEITPPEERSDRPQDQPPNVDPRPSGDLIP